jgi:hypothetical protein
MRACDCSREASAWTKLSCEHAASCSGASDASCGSCLSTMRSVEASSLLWMWCVRKRPMYPGSDDHSQFSGSPIFAANWRMANDEAAIVAKALNTRNDIPRPPMIKTAGLVGLAGPAESPMVPFL